RLRGEMLLSLGKKAEAEAGLRRALTIAQQQQARWWEVGAATSLAKHWRAGGRYVEGPFLPQPVSSWLPGGFDAPDLKYAQALLNEVSALSGTRAGCRGNRSALGKL